MTVGIPGQARALASAIWNLERRGGGAIWVHCATYEGEHLMGTPECPCRPSLVVVEPLH